MEEGALKELNEALRLLLNMDPLTEFCEPTTQGQVTMNYGLAKMYADEGFRLYLQVEINRALKATAVRSITLVDMAAGKARVLTLKELLIKSKRAFEELQRIQASAKRKELENK